LKLDFILDNQGFALCIDGLWELGRDGMMSSLVFDNETFVTFHTIEDTGFFNSPVANIGPLFLGALLLFLFGMRRFPPCVPVIGELL
jgi:hypothetical protein